MIGRGFGIEMEDSYGEEVEKTDFHPSFWNEANSMNFTLNDDIITKSGGSYQVAANLVFDSEFALNDAVVVKYRVAANYYPTCVANLVSIYDSADFNTKYSSLVNLLPLEHYLCKYLLRQSLLLVLNTNHPVPNTHHPRTEEADLLYTQTA